MDWEQNSKYVFGVFLLLNTWILILAGYIGLKKSIFGYDSFVKARGFLWYSASVFVGHVHEG